MSGIGANEIVSTITPPVTISAADQRLMHVADTESTRYALGGVYFNCKMAVATDGRKLVARVKSSAVDNRVIGFNKADQPAPKVKKGIDPPKDTERTMEFLPFADRLQTADGKFTAHEIEGRFPRYQEFFPSEKPVMRITIDAEYLLEMAKAMTPNGEARTVNIDIINPNSPFVITSNHDANVAGILMPCTFDGEEKLESGQEILKRLAGDPA